VFDKSSIKKICPPSFDCFDFIPSVGASGETFIIWKGSHFSGHVIAQNSYAMSIEFVSIFSGATWVLTNIYASCSTEGKRDFLNWLHDFELSEGTNWLLVGDFNLIR
jgi:hypothetical protein